MENEIMNNDEIMEEVEATEVETEGSGMGTGMARLIGAGLAFASTAAVKLGKKAIAAYKTKKALRKSTESDDTEVIDEK